MRYRLTFISGVAVGYVLGTRAGRERYEQLRKSAQRISQNPAVRNTAESAAHNGRRVAEKAVDKAKTLRDQRERAKQGTADSDDWGTSNT